MDQNFVSKTFKRFSFNSKNETRRKLYCAFEDKSSILMLSIYYLKKTLIFGRVHQTLVEINYKGRIKLENLSSIARKQLALEDSN